MNTHASWYFIRVNKMRTVFLHMDFFFQKVDRHIHLVGQKDVCFFFFFFFFYFVCFFVCYLNLAMKSFEGIFFTNYGASLLYS